MTWPHLMFAGSLMFADAGTDLLDDAFEHFGNDKIHTFEGKWVGNSSFRDNYDEYMRNIAKNMSREDAAWNTWTGRQMKRRGFTKVDVPEPIDNIVHPVFTK